MEVWNVEEEKGVLEKKATKKIEERDWDKCESYKFRSSSLLRFTDCCWYPKYKFVGWCMNRKAYDRLFRGRGLLEVLVMQVDLENAWYI